MPQPDHLQIPLLQPDLPHPEEYLAELLEIHSRCRYTNFGPSVQLFETALAQYLCPQSAGVHIGTASSGTAALQLLLAALELPAAARVLVPSLTFPASAQAVLAAGLNPILSGVCPQRWQLTPELASEILERHRFDAVLPVATFGMPVDASAWSDWSRETGIPVVIDAAAAFDGQQVASGCHVAVSLHATKSFGIGEGGLMLSTDIELLNRARQLSNFGFSHSVVHMRGCNGKLAEMPAAVGLAQLRRWPAQVARRTALWGQMCEALAPFAGQIGLMPARPRAPSVFVVEVLAGAAGPLSDFLSRHGVGNRRWYYPPLHQHPALEDLPRDQPSLDRVEALCERLLGLPFGPFLVSDQIARVASTIGKYFSECSRSP